MYRQTRVPKCKLIPIEGKSNTVPTVSNVEYVMLIADEIPTALFHIDTLWFGDHELHNRLSDGEEVECEMVFEYEDKEE